MKLDKSKIKGFDQIGSSFKGLSFDPNMTILSLISGELSALSIIKVGKKSTTALG